MKLLFMHNAIPEYRIPWFRELSKLCDVTFVFTNEQLIQKLYNQKIDFEKIIDLDYKIIRSEKDKKNLYAKIKDYDFVELPPIDSLNEWRIGKIVIKECKKNNIKYGYFWEKWEAPYELQPTSRKIKNFILKYAAKSIYHESDIIFAGGSKSKEYFIDCGMREDKIVVLPDASRCPKCDYVDIRKKYTISSEKKIILYFGRIIPQKGLNILIESFAQLNDDNFFLLVAGDGSYRKECEALAEKLKIKNILFVGSVDPNYRSIYFSQCDIFVFPGTYFEGRVDVWGLTINEAIQYGKIVISTTAVGSAIDLITDDVNGYLVEPGNVIRLEEAIKKTGSNRLKKSALIEDEQLNEKYSYDMMAVSYYETVIKVLKI